MTRLHERTLLTVQTALANNNTAVPAGSLVQDPNSYNLRVYSLAAQPQDLGKIIIGGNFNSYESTLRNRIARLNPDGSIDPTFNPGAGANALVLSLVLQPDGKILVGGSFSTFDGALRSRIARLNQDGSLDTSFNPGTGATSSKPISSVSRSGGLTRQSDSVSRP